MPSSRCPEHPILTGSRRRSAGDRPPPSPERARANSHNPVKNGRHVRTNLHVKVRDVPSLNREQLGNSERVFHYKRQNLCLPPKSSSLKIAGLRPRHVRGQPIRPILAQGPQTSHAGTPDGPPNPEVPTRPQMGGPELG